MKKKKIIKTSSVYPFLDHRTPKANSEKLPVKLTVFLQGAQFRVGLKLYATPDVFDKATSSGGSNLKDEYKVHSRREWRN